jgi:hypothetical protein
MKPITLRLKVATISTFALFVTVGSSTTGRERLQSLIKPSPCAGPDYRMFDFWVGDWDAFDVGNPVPVARVRVDRILDGCVLREDFGFDVRTSARKPEIAR